jgi:outer membrane protein assembly factor BamA
MTGAAPGWAGTTQSDPEAGKMGSTGVPIVGYDDKSGWLYGGAGFLYSEIEPGTNAAIFLVVNFRDFYSSTLNYELRSGDWLISFHGLVERAFDNYYGEGDLSPSANPEVMSLYHFEAQAALLYRFFPHFRAGLYDDDRSRIETSLERQAWPVAGDPQRLFPNEDSDAVGLRAQWDTRDRILNTRRGDFLQASLSNSQGNWTNLPDKGGFSQLALDLRHFSTLRRHLVLASRFLGALSNGQPSYLFRYRLGGLDTLRGYKDNRFRGADFFLVQEELRWQLLNWLSANLASDLGDIGDGTFHQLKWTGQLGLRIGLPPNWVQKLRIDLGYGLDQQTFQIQFGEVF